MSFNNKIERSNFTMRSENHKRKHRTRRRGFSLMELMVVLLIIGLLSAAVTVSVRQVRAQGRKTTAELEITNIANGLEMFNSATARYPTQDEGLDVLLDVFGDLDSPILDKKGELKDPWGNDYLYISTPDQREPFEVLSAGADGREGTDDDISNLTEKE